MARSVNKATLIGNLGSDPEVRSTPSGVKVATLSVATNRQWRSRDGETQEKTEWHRVVCWDRLAELAERYMQKGERIYVEGRIEYRKWEDQQGVTRWTTEIRAMEVVLLGSGDRSRGRGAGGRDDTGGWNQGSGGSSYEQQNDRKSSFGADVATDDDLPF